MFAGATAKPILANLSTYQLRNLILWHADEIQAAGLGNNWDEFRSELKQLRQAGVYVSYGEVDADLVGIGAAIFNPEHKVIGSLVFILAQKRATARLVKQLQEEVGRAAAEISARLVASAQPSTLPSRPPRVKTGRVA
jgi:DNA-binding IclR family transcriptional regulator